MLKIASLMVLSIGLASASPTFVTPSGSVDSPGGDPVDATAAFMFSAGNLQIILTNLEPNLKDAGQLLTDLQFTLSTSTPLTLGTESASQIAIDGSGAVTDEATTPEWTLSGGTTTYTLTFPNPINGIIGPPDGSGVYSAANGSIAGNPGHTSFWQDSATFNFTFTGDTIPSITAVTFSFGTQADDNIGGMVGVPEPASIALATLGLLGLGLIRRRRSR